LLLEAYRFTRKSSRSKVSQPRWMRSSFAELAGATTAMVLPGTSAGGFRGFGMEEGGKKEVYNASGRYKLIQNVDCCADRNDATK
jgi:hypothetical protein